MISHVLPGQELANFVFGHFFVSTLISFSIFNIYNEDGILKFKHQIRRFFEMNCNRELSPLNLNNVRDLMLTIIPHPPRPLQTHTHTRNITNYGIT